MKPKVLLAGGTGYIGKYLSRVIEKDAELTHYLNILNLIKDLQKRLHG